MMGLKENDLKTIYPKKIEKSAAIIVQRDASHFA